MTSNSKVPNPQSRNLISIFQGKTKFMIYTYLKIYRQLTSNQLCEFLNKSKSTIHKHLHDFMDLGLINEPQIRDKEGNFIYTLSPDAESVMANLDAEVDLKAGFNASNIRQIAESNVYLLQKNILLYELEIEFWNSILKFSDMELESRVTDLYNQIFSFERDEEGNIILEDGKPKGISKSINMLKYMTPKETQKFNESLKQGNSSLPFQDAEESGLEGAHPTKQFPPRTDVFIGHLIPLKIILDFLNSKRTS